MKSGRVRCPWMKRVRWTLILARCRVSDGEGVGDTPADRRRLLWLAPGCEHRRQSTIQAVTTTTLYRDTIAYNICICLARHIMR